MSSRSTRAQVRSDHEQRGLLLDLRGRHQFSGHQSAVKRRRLQFAKKLRAKIDALIDPGAPESSCDTIHYCMDTRNASEIDGERARSGEYFRVRSNTVNQRWRCTYERGRRRPIRKHWSQCNNFLGTGLRAQLLVQSLCECIVLHGSSGKSDEDDHASGPSKEIDLGACFSVSAPSPLSGSRNMRLAPIQSAHMHLPCTPQETRRDQLAMNHGRFRLNGCPLQCSDTALR
jgi:hypothetical protein